MASYKLQSGEGVLLKSTNVSRVTTEWSTSCELILTNMNFVYVYGDFKKKPVSVPLSRIKVLDGRVQAVMSSRNSGDPILEIYFTEGHPEAFDFHVAPDDDEDDNDSVLGAFFEVGKDMKEIFFGQSKKERQKEMNENARRKKAKTLEIQKWIDAVNRAVLGDFSPADGSPQAQAHLVSATGEQAACKCTSCSAPVSGHKGGIVRCEYCDTDQLL